jgi:hypothetical protein
MRRGRVRAAKNAETFRRSGSDNSTTLRRILTDNPIGSCDKEHFGIAREGAPAANARQLEPTATFR